MNANTNAKDSNGIRPYLGVSLVSASVLALQVIFTRIFSIMIWHHFTYLIVGIALLGGGRPACSWRCVAGSRTH